MDPLTLGLLFGGGQVAAGGLGAIGSYMAQKQQLAAADRARNALTGAYNTATGYQQPYQQAGLQGLGQLQTGDYGTAVPGQYQYNAPAPYQAQAFNYQEDPGMAYRMQTGQRAIESSAAGQGTGLSGATLKALNRFGQNLGSQEYGNAFNRYMQQRQQALPEYQTNLGAGQWGAQFGANQGQQQYENLNQQQMQRYGQASNLAGIGQTAAGNLGNLSTGYGSNLASLYGQAGNAQAAGNMGMMQGAGTALGGGLQGFAAPYMLKGLMGGGSGSGMSSDYWLNNRP